MTDAERAIWNQAVDAAAAACRDVERAAEGQGHVVHRARASLKNPNGHRCGELRLGAARCLTAVEDLRK